MISLQFQKKKQYFLCFLLMIFFITSSLFCYPQNDKKSFNLIKKFRYPTALKISMRVADHDGVSFIEEYLIYPKKETDTSGVFKMSMYSKHISVAKHNIDTALILSWEQFMILEDFCEYIYQKKIPKKYSEKETSLIIAGVFITYTMEIAGERYQFTDKKMLSLGQLLLFGKTDWYEEDW